MERQDGREDFLTAIMGGEKQGLILDPAALFSNAMGLTSVHPFFFSSSRSYLLTSAKSRWLPNHRHNPRSDLLPSPAESRRLP